MVCISMTFIVPLALTFVMHVLQLPFKPIYILDVDLRVPGDKSPLRKFFPYWNSGPQVRGPATSITCITKDHKEL